MNPRFQIDVDELQRGLFCALLVSSSVALLYLLLAFTVTTIRVGAMNTWNTLAKRVQNTADTISKPLADMILEADELGEASLFERFPYPDPDRSLLVHRKSSGIGQWTVTRFVLAGTNLDVLRSVEVSLDGVPQDEDAPVEHAPTRDADTYEWTPKTLTSMTSTPIKAVVTVIAYGGARWRHVLTVECRDEADDSMVLAGQRRPKNPNGGPKPAASTAATTAHPTAPTSSAPPPPPAPEGPRDDGQAELADLIAGMTSIPTARRMPYAKLARDNNFGEAQLAVVLSDLSHGRASSAEIDEQMVRLLSARYMTNRKLNGQLAPLHNASLSEIREAIHYDGRAKLLGEIDAAGSVSDGIRSVLGKAHTAAMVAAPAASASAAAIAAAGNSEDQLSEQQFQAIWDQEEKYRDCMAIVDLLQKAYDVDNQDSAQPGPFDPKRLLAKGHLEYIPSCPDGAGGEYTMDPAMHRVHCTRHGSRALPWPERRQYELHFNDYERARILAWKQNRTGEAIGTLKSYLARNRGREEANLHAQAFLGRLLFETGSYETAVDILKKLSDRFPKSVRLAYETAKCFYVKNNEQLALEYVDLALKPEPKEFDRVFDEESTPYQLYLLRDEADWMRRNLAPTRLMPDGTLRALAPVRYAEFAIKTHPPSRAKTCYESLIRLRDMVPGIARAMRAKVEFQNRYHRHEIQLDQLKTTPEYDTKGRNHAREALREVRLQLKDMAVEILRDAKIGGPPFVPCPGCGVYQLTVEKHLSLDCTCHPGILPAEHIDVSPALSPREVQMTDLVLQHVMMALSPPLLACVERQRRILEQFQTEDLDILIPAEANLADLERDGRIPKGTLSPGGDEAYDLVASGDKRVLQCNQHYSLQKLGAWQDGVNLLENAK